MKTRVAKLIGLDNLPGGVSQSVAAIANERIESLAAVTSTGIRSVCSWLKGDREPSTLSLALMADHYGTTVDWLLRGVGPEPTNALEPLDVDAVERLASGGRS